MRKMEEPPRPAIEYFVGEYCPVCEKVEVVGISTGDGRSHLWARVRAWWKGLGVPLGR